MLRRKAYEYLLEWKTRKKKALCVTGARQTDKTTLIREFGRQLRYANSFEWLAGAGVAPP